jgi:hypothetical protein
MTIDTLVDKYNQYISRYTNNMTIQDMIASLKIINEIYKYAKTLEAEIESLKCCGNCKHDNDTPTDTAEDHYCYDCENNNKWEKRL